MVKITVTKKSIYVLAIVLGILCLGVGVYAYNYPGLASVMGHTMNELERPTGSGVLMFSSGSWVYTTNLPLACPHLYFLQYNPATRTFSCDSY